MSAVHHNPWIAQVHAHLIKTQVPATCSQMQKLFGRPDGIVPARKLLFVAMSGNWFYVAWHDPAGRGANYYSAIAKTKHRNGPDRKPRKSRAVFRAPIESRHRGYASVWGMADGVMVDVPMRGPDVLVHLIGDNEDNEESGEQE